MENFLHKNGHLIARNARVTHNSVKIWSEPETNIPGNRFVFRYFVLFFQSKRFGLDIYSNFENRIKFKVNNSNDTFI